MRLGFSTRVSRHMRVGVSVPIHLLAQPKYKKSRMKPTKPPKGAALTPWRIMGLLVIGIIGGPFLMGLWCICIELVFIMLFLPVPPLPH
jgi:hypothetical protein